MELESELDKSGDRKPGLKNFVQDGSREYCIFLADAVPQALEQFKQLQLK